MTTQSDRELKARIYDRINAEIDGGARPGQWTSLNIAVEETNKEWQAKVQGLVDAFSATMILLNDAMIWNRPGNRKKFSDQMDRNRQALTQFASGQPAKGVMSDEDFMREDQRWNCP